ncbi:MAG TPA: hypothetical protein VGB84_05610 [Arachidicoccus sp.]
MNKVLSYSTNFTDRKTSLKRAVAILAKNDINVNDSEAVVILDFLYDIARNYNKHKAHKNVNNLKGKSNLLKT